MHSNNPNKQQGIGMTSARTRRRLVEQMRAFGITHAETLQVMESLPRHIFVDEAIASRVYENTALPIGHGQTISQPYIVALMTQTLFDRARANVLEIGTGCGYQTALLAALCDKVVSIERIRALHRKARDRCYDLGYRNIVFRHGDGFAGLENYAPYDGILAAAVSADVPDELVAQLAPNGRLIMPVGAGEHQVLTVIDRQGDTIKKTQLEAVRFVPRLAGLG